MRTEDRRDGVFADRGVTFHVREYYGDGRWSEKTVTNAGQYKRTVVTCWDGWQLAATYDGSGNPYQQFVHGTQYIDELIMMRVADKGDFYVHQDANWNVIALTDLGGHVVERYSYTPYGELTVDQLTSFGDRDGDGDVDSTDKGSVGTTCTGTLTGACRILDLDFDGDYDSADATLFDTLTQGVAKHPNQTASAVDMPFGHQGLYYDAELGQYDYRAGHYDPVKHRVMQPVSPGIARYIYRGGNPIGTGDDPWGLGGNEEDPCPPPLLPGCDQNPLWPPGTGPYPGPIAPVPVPPPLSELCCTRSAVGTIELCKDVGGQDCGDDQEFGGDSSYGPDTHLQPRCADGTARQNCRLRSCCIHNSEVECQEHTYYMWYPKSSAPAACANYVCPESKLVPTGPPITISNIYLEQWECDCCPEDDVCISGRHPIHRYHRGVHRYPESKSTRRNRSISGV